MKNSTVLAALTLGAVLLISAGCKHSSVGLTNIPGRTQPVGGSGQNGLNGGDTTTPQPPFVVTNPQLPVEVPPQIKPGTDIPFPTNSQATAILDGPHDEDRAMFEKDTVYFDTDSAVIKASEQSKLEEVSKYFKTTGTDALLVEGYCDERGTEGYNLALGDRRALAVREYLVTLGVEPGRVATVSLGEAKPANPGHNESAWKANRRGVSVRIMPKK